MFIFLFIAPYPTQLNSTCWTESDLALWTFSRHDLSQLNSAQLAKWVGLSRVVIVFISPDPTQLSLVADILKMFRTWRLTKDWPETSWDESDRKSVHSAPGSATTSGHSKAERGGTEFQRLSFWAVWVPSPSAGRALSSATAPHEVIYALHVIKEKYYIKISHNISQNAGSQSSEYILQSSADGPQFLEFSAC